MSESDPIIEVRDLRFAYNGEAIFDGNSFAIRPGQFAMVVGPNGGGKTTLLKLLLGLLAPTGGTCRVLGSEPHQVRRQVGYVPQHMEIDPKFPVSVLDVALMGCLGRTSLFGPYRKRDKRRAMEALGQVGMAEAAGQSFASQSGGQRQRVLIARCLAGGPRLLLLDEPTSNLDAASEEEFFRLLSLLNTSLTILMVSHDVGFVTQFVDTVVCVNRSISVHPTAELTGASIAELYQQDIRLVRHDHNCTEGHTE